MFDFTRGRFSHQFSSFRRQWCQQQQLPFTDVLSAERVEAVLAEEGVSFRRSQFTPLVTLWTFLGQVLSPDHSCREAVAHLIAFLVGQGKRHCAPHSGAYCEARQRLPQTVPARLVRRSGDQLHARVPLGKSQVAGRPVYVIDGTTVSMPDTAANQSAYPQPRTQRPGLGFPIARLVVLFSLASGAVVDMALGKYKGKGTGETSLFRQLLARLQPESVLLGDRHFCTYWNLALLLNRDVHSLFRLHQMRKADPRRGFRLGTNDRLVTWPRPERPSWMTRQEYQEMPPELYIRLIWVRVPQRGFRVRELCVATTLLDPSEAPAVELADLFRARWQAELHLRSLKSVLQMDVLRCKTPDMVHKELWMHLLAYNLIREVMAQAASLCGTTVYGISFKATLQTLNRFQSLLETSKLGELPELYRALLRAVAKHRVGDRPDRYEPRAIKRRPKPHDLLTLPRTEARKLLIRTA
jgi:hypothetical protein